MQASEQVSVTRLRLIDFKNLNNSGDQVVPEMELNGALTISPSDASVQFGAYPLGASEVEQINRTIAEQLVCYNLCSFPRQTVRLCRISPVLRGTNFLELCRNWFLRMKPKRRPLSTFQVSFSLDRLSLTAWAISSLFGSQQFMPHSTLGTSSAWRSSPLLVLGPRCISST